MGVVTKEGQYRLIDSGPLPEAVAASAAIPFVFAPVHVPGTCASLRHGHCISPAHACCGISRSTPVPRFKPGVCGLHDDS